MHSMYKQVVCIVLYMMNSVLYAHDSASMVSLYTSLQSLAYVYKTEDDLSYISARSVEKLLTIPEKYTSIIRGIAYGMRHSSDMQQNNRIAYSEHADRLVYSLFDGVNGSYVAEFLNKQGSELLSNVQLNNSNKQKAVFLSLYNELQKDPQAALQGAFIASAIMQDTTVWLTDLSLYPCVIYANGTVNNRKIQQKAEAKYIETIQEAQGYQITSDTKGFHIPYKDQNTVKYITMYKKVFGFPGDFFSSQSSADSFPEVHQLRPYSPLSYPLLNWYSYDLSSDASNPIAAIVLSNNAVQKVLSNEDIAVIVKSGLAEGKNVQALVGNILDRAQKMTQENVACIVVCTQNVLKEKVFSEKYPTFTSWYDACKKLPFNRDLNKKDEYAITDLIVSWDEFDYMREILCAHYKHIYGSVNLWFQEKMPSRIFFDDLKFPAAYYLSKEKKDDRFIVGYNSKESIEPFVEHCIVPNNAHVAFHGDFHGDIHSMIEYLAYLKSIKFIDDSFTIIDPSKYMVFLGDYTDRGHYGIEVIYTIMRLKLANPDRVILIRGNHEDITITNEYGFTDEVIAKFGDGNDDAGRQMCNKIHKIYDYMPVAVWLGTTTDLLQCCHGGMELGYNPQLFLKSGKKYGLLVDIARKHNFQTIIAKNAFFKDTFKDDFFTITYNSIEKDLVFSDHKVASYDQIGFLWSDFLIDAQAKTYYRQGRGMQCGALTTEALLKFASYDVCTIQGVFRAHQHSSSWSDMMKEILRNSVKFAYKGLSLLWGQEKYLVTHKNNDDIPLWSGIVATFNVGPDSDYGSGCGFSYDTFGILKLAQDFKDWRLQVVNQEIIK